MTRASEGFEVFSAWYQTAAPTFTAAQREEWDHSLEPLVEEWLKRNPGHAMPRRSNETTANAQRQPRMAAGPGAE